MTQAHPVPDVHARGGLAVENMTGFAIALIGAGQRDDEIELRAGIDYPTDAAQHAIHLSVCSEAIDVNGLQARGLREEFLVRHFENPRQWKVSKYDRTTTDVHQDSVGYPTNKFAHFVAWENSAPRANPFPTFDADQTVSIVDLMNNFQFSLAAPRECAPIAIPPACSRNARIAVGASNSISTPDLRGRA